MAKYVFNATDTNVLNDFTHIAGPEVIPTIESSNDGRTVIQWSSSFTTNDQLWQYDPAGNQSGTVEIVTLLKSGSTPSTNLLGAFAFGSGTPGSTNSITASIGAGNNAFDSLIDVLESGDAGNLIDQALRNDNWLYRRLRCKNNGDGTITVRQSVWTEDGTEPASWSQEKTFATSTVDGAVGLYIYQDEPMEYLGGVITDDGTTADATQIDTQKVLNGIPATVLENPDGTLDTGRAVTRTITRVSDSTQLFSGSQTSDGTTAELPEIDLSATSAATGEAVDDRIVQSTPSNPSAAAVTIRRNVGDIS